MIPFVGALRPRRVLRLVVLATLVGGALVAYFVVTSAQVWLASRADHARPADAIVVLGAAQYDGRPSGALRGRLDHAVGLWRDGYAPLIVPTGGKQDGDRVTEGFAGYQYLRNAGVPDSQILVEVDAANTYEAVSAARAILAERGLSRAILVSDSYHNLRLQGIAAEVGLDAVVSPTDAPVEAQSWLRETAAVGVGRIVGYRRLATL